MPSLISLFFSAFLAATLLPAQSELLLGALVLRAEHAPWVLIVVAGVGNTLGSCVNWVLGRFCLRYQDARWFPVRESMRLRAEVWYGKYGRWSLLLSWAPIIGDPLTLVAGLLREPFVSFVLLVAVAKFVRYVFVVFLAMGFM